LGNAIGRIFGLWERRTNPDLKTPVRENGADEWEHASFMQILRSLSSRGSLETLSHAFSMSMNTARMWCLFASDLVTMSWRRMVWSVVFLLWRNQIEHHWGGGKIPNTILVGWPPFFPLFCRRCLWGKLVYTRKGGWKVCQVCKSEWRWNVAKSAEMSTDQDWIGLDQGWSQFWPDQDWIGLQLFSQLADQDWIGLRKFLFFWCDYSENIKKLSCDPISQVC